MKLYFAFSILTLFIPAIAGQKDAELTPECSQIREKLNKNMNFLENVANTAQGIQQKDCNFAKSSARLTKKYGKCLSSQAQDGMDTVYKNMRFVTRIICENVNKRDFMAKQKPKTETSELEPPSKPQIRKKRFLLQNLIQSIGNGLQARQEGGSQSPGLSMLSGLTEHLSSLGRKSRRGTKSLTPLEQQCCMVHLQSDCFLSKVLHTCAEKSELRLYKAFQTVFSLAVRDVVEIACGRIENLDQCEKYSNDYDADQDLGF